MCLDVLDVGLRSGRAHVHSIAIQLVSRDRDTSIGHPKGVLVGQAWQDLSEESFVLCLVEVEPSHLCQERRVAASRVVNPTAIGNQAIAAKQN